jgi:SAM-dependent methyltransferase
MNNEEEADVMTTKSSDLSETYIGSDRADSWHRAKQRREESTGAVTELMLDLADLRPGDRVLDVAAGTGDSSLIAARRVEPNGHVLAVDMSANMLKRAEASAREAGLTNIETRVMNAATLEFEANSLDVVICRLALMLFANPTAALAEIHRVVKPTRKVAVMVFSAPERNPFHGLALQVARGIGNMPTPPPGQPGMFALGGEGLLDHVYRQAGFNGVSIHPGTIRRRYSSLQDAIQGMKGSSAALHDLMVKLSEADQDRAWEQIEKGLSQFAGPDGFDAPGEVLIGVGTK